MNQFRPHLYLLIVNLFYGAGFSVTKLVMPQYIGPFGFIVLRVSVTLLLFVLLLVFAKREMISLRDLPLMAVCGLFGVAINQLMFFKGLSITTPINAALIMITTPILVLLLSAFTGKEAMRWYKAAGLLLGATGALLILAGKGFAFSSATLLGDVFILINAASYAVYLVIAKPLMKKYEPLTVITWVFFFGLFPVVLAGFNEFVNVTWRAIPIAAWAGIVFIVLCTTFFAYLLNMLALRQVNSSVVGAYIYLQPILATLIASTIGQDKLTAEKFVSGAFIFAGVYLVSFGKRHFENQ